jgi:hypothetical protein
LLVSGKRYALTLQLMLKKSRNRKNSSRSPTLPREPQRPPMPMAIDPSLQHPGMHHGRHPETFSPAYDNRHAYPPQLPPQQHTAAYIGQQPMPFTAQQTADAEHIWQDVGQASHDHLPVWIDDECLGGATFTQHGMNAFFLPEAYLPTRPQIW